MSSRPAVSVVDVEEVRDRVDAVLAAHVSRERALVATIGADAAVLCDAITQMLSGGKRLRASLCYWSWRAHGGEAHGPGADAVIAVGAALELFQAAALFHDDVMDASDTRRGLPAAHRTFEARHREQGWSGEAARYGESAAILLGDLALVASESTFARALSRLPARAATTARDVFDLMRTQVTVGQYLDVLAQALPWGADPVADEARAREVIRSKTARYSVEHPIVLGAALAGADDDQLDACRRLGLPLGEAFQLRDDLLGIFGDPAVTGKPAGDDLREGKRTVVVARAMHAGDAATRHLLASRLGDRSMSTEDVAALAAAIEATGAPDDVEQLIAELAGTARSELDAAQLADPGADMLRRLAAAVVDRVA